MAFIYPLSFFLLSFGWTQVESIHYGQDQWANTVSHQMTHFSSPSSSASLLPFSSLSLDMCVPTETVVLLGVGQSGQTDMFRNWVQQFDNFPLASSSSFPEVSASPTGVSCVTGEVHEACLQLCQTPDLLQSFHNTTDHLLEYIGLWKTLETKVSDITGFVYMYNQTEEVDAIEKAKERLFRLKKNKRRRKFGKRPIEIKDSELPTSLTQTRDLTSFLWGRNEKNQQFYPQIEGQTRTIFSLTNETTNVTYSITTHLAKRCQSQQTHILDGKYEGRLPVLLDILAQGKSNQNRPSAVIIPSLSAHLDALYEMYADTYLDLRQHSLLLTRAHQLFNKQATLLGVEASFIPGLNPKAVQYIFEHLDASNITSVFSYVKHLNRFVNVYAGLPEDQTLAGKAMNWHKMLDALSTLGMTSVEEDDDSDFIKENEEADNEATDSELDAKAIEDSSTEVSAKTMKNNHKSHSWVMNWLPYGGNVVGAAQMFRLVYHMFTQRKAIKNRRDEMKRFQEIQEKLNIIAKDLQNVNDVFQRKDQFLDFVEQLPLRNMTVDKMLNLSPELENGKMFTDEETIRRNQLGIRENVENSELIKELRQANKHINKRQHILDLGSTESLQTEMEKANRAFKTSYKPTPFRGGAKRNALSPSFGF